MRFTLLDIPESEQPPLVFGIPSAVVAEIMPKKVSWSSKKGGDHNESESNAGILPTKRKRSICGSVPYSANHPTVVAIQGLLNNGFGLNPICAVLRLEYTTARRWQKQGFLTVPESGCSD